MHPTGKWKYRDPWTRNITLCSTRYALTVRISLALLNAGNIWEITKSTHTVDRCDIEWRCFKLFKLHGLVEFVHLWPVWVCAATQIRLSEWAALQWSSTDSGITDLPKISKTNCVPIFSNKITKHNWTSADVPSLTKSIEWEEFITSHSIRSLNFQSPVPVWEPKHVVVFSPQSLQHFLDFTLKHQMKQPMPGVKCRSSVGVVQELSCWEIWYPANHMPIWRMPEKYNYVLHFPTSICRETPPGHSNAYIGNQSRELLFTNMSARGRFVLINTDICLHMSICTHAVVMVLPLRCM